MKNKIKGVGIFSMIIIIALFIHIHNLNKKIQARESMIVYCSLAIDGLNGDMDDMESVIVQAKSQAWTDYDNMGYTLEDMDTFYPQDINHCYTPTSDQVIY